MPIDSKVKKLIEEKVNSLGYDLAELTYGRENKENILHVIIDKVDEVTLDDIVKVSDEISSLLDELDPIEANYMLDVASLGAEKPLKIEKLGDYVTKYVNLHLSNPYKGENILEGTLVSVNDDEVVLTIRIKSKSKDITLPRKDIDKARLAIKF